jgi:fucose permease
MGLADAMGPMSDGVKDHYHLNNVMATLLPFFVFIAFAVCSVPAGLLAGRIGKKNLLLLGLGLNTLAVLVASFPLQHYEVLLGCIFLLGVGTTFLQVAGNPIMRDVSAAGNYSRNLSFAQGFKGLGSTVSTFLVGAVTAIALLAEMEWRGIFPIFTVLMALAFVMVGLVSVRETKAEEPPSIASSLRLLKEPVFFLAVLGIFLYVGAEVSMTTFLTPTLKGLGMEEATANRFGPTMFLLVLGIGRILGGAVLTAMSPRTCFRLSALLGLLGAVAFIADSKLLALAGVVVAGSGFANIWPMLFSITVEERPDRANELSGLMCMAISGGAIVPLLMGELIDKGVARPLAFVVPAACFAYLLLLSLKSGRKVAAA